MESPTGEEQEDSSSNSIFRLFTEDSIPKEDKETTKGKKISKDGPDPDEAFEDGRRLSDNLLEKFDSKMACIPLEEIDAAYEGEQTFIVVGKLGTIHRFSATDSMYMFGPLNPLRKAILFLVTHWSFSAFMVAVVLINVLLLANKAHDAFDYVCAAIYILELILKVISRGFILDAFTCIRDPWSWVDIVIIVSSILRPFEFHCMMTIQWIRLLKIIPLISDMKRAFNAIIDSIIQLCVAIFVGFILSILISILGLTTYMGVLSQVCVKNTELIGKQYFEFNFNPDNWIKDPHTGGGLLCGNTSSTTRCPDNSTCLQGFGKNPDFGYTNFDSIVWSSFATYRILVQDFLEAIILPILETSGFWNLLYFILAFFFGTYAIRTLAFGLLGDKYYRDKIAPQQKFDELGPSTEEVKTTEDNTQASDIHPFTNFMKWLSENLVFEAFVTCVIIWDIICLTHPALFSHGSMMSGSPSIYWNAIPVLSVYCVEAIVKFSAVGPKRYFSCGWHIFDLAVIALLINSLVKLCLGRLTTFGSIRIFKLVPRSTTLQITFKIILKSIKRLWALFGVIITLWVYYALSSIELFKEKYRKNVHLFPDEMMPRWNFNDFIHSFLIVFRSWAGETIEVLWDCMIVGGSSCFVYFPLMHLTGILTITMIMVRIVFIAMQIMKSVDPENKSTLTKLGDFFCNPLDKLTENCRGKYGTKVDVEEIANNETTDPEADDKNKSRNKSQSIEEYQKKMQRVLDMNISNVVIILFILLSSAVLFWESVHQRSSGSVPTVLFVTDIVFVTLLSALVVFELVSYGLKTSLTSASWLFDTLIVVETILHLSLNLYDVPNTSYGAFYFVRSLRPFLLVSRIQCLEAAVTGLWHELKFLKRYIAAGILIWLFFAIHGFEMFTYKFYKCVEPETEKIIYANEKYNGVNITSKTECLVKNLSWANSRLNFDSPCNGFVALTFVGLRNGWIEIMYNAFDTKMSEQDANFVKENAIERTPSLFFILFMIIGIMIVPSVLFGVTLHHLKQENLLAMFYTSNQLESLKTQKSSKECLKKVSEDIERPETAFRGTLFDIVNSTAFDAVVMVVIVLDVICHAWSWYQMDSQMETVIRIIRLCILIVYLLEFGMKFTGMGIQYFRSGWNIMDFIILTISFFGTIFYETMMIYFIDQRILRPLRLLRIFQFRLLLSWQKDLCKFVHAFRRSKSALFNLLCFQILFMFSYSVFGMSVFGELKKSTELYAHANFETFTGAFLSLFFITTFSGSETIFFALTNETDCNLADPETKSRQTCGDKRLGTFFFYSYIFVSVIVFMNLYLIFILEIFTQLESNSDETEDEMDEKTAVLEHDLENGQDTRQNSIDLENDVEANEVE